MIWIKEYKRGLTWTRINIHKKGIHIHTYIRWVQEQGHVNDIGSGELSKAVAIHIISIKSRSL